MALHLVVLELDPQVTMGLMIAECAKPNECNDWLMHVTLTISPMVVWDKMVTLEWIVSH